MALSLRVQLGSPVSGQKSPVCGSCWYATGAVSPLAMWVTAAMSRSMSAAVVDSPALARTAPGT